MRKLQKRLIAIIIFAISFVTGTTGLVYILGFGTLERDRSTALLISQAEQSAYEINYILREIEQQVAELESFAVRYLPTEAEIQQKELRAQYLDLCESIARAIAEHDEKVGAIYYRLSPTLGNATEGFFFTRRESTGDVEQHVPTDISEYAPDDREHVAWYYETIENGQATWLIPYFNRNINMSCISYTVPIYFSNGELVGVLGIDFNYRKLEEDINNIRLLEHGYGMLTEKDGHVLVWSENNILIFATDIRNIIQEVPDGTIYKYTVNNIKYVSLHYGIRNGTELVLTVPEEELIKEERSIELTVMVVLLLLLTAMILLFLRVIHRTFYIAQKDGLTMALGRNAYMSVVEEIDADFQQYIQGEGISLLVFDINGLKHVNDHFGHSAGDSCIRDAYESIRQFFPLQELYRIGGDEFVILSKKTQLLLLVDAMEKFQAEMRRREQDRERPPTTALLSVGIAYADEKKHHCVADIFQDADEKMYEDKRRFYERHEDMRRD